MHKACVKNTHNLCNTKRFCCTISSHAHQVNKHVKSILFANSQRQQFSFCQKMEMSSALSIRCNKCAHKTTSKLRHVQQHHFGCSGEGGWGVRIVINELKFRTIKDIFTKNMLFTLSGMKRNKCEIYAFSFIYWFVVLWLWLDVCIAQSD